jgi:hypothetical protein
VASAFFFGPFMKLRQAVEVWIPATWTVVKTAGASADNDSGILNGSALPAD